MKIMPFIESKMYLRRLSMSGLEVWCNSPDAAAACFFFE